MKRFYNNVFIALMVVFIPFFAQAQISGSSSVCVGSSIPLSDLNSGGIWGSSNALVASVDGSGNVSGVAAGIAVISYSYVNISFALVIDTMSVTVNPLPDAGTITGVTS